MQKHRLGKPKRIARMLKQLEQVWKKHPDWRLGQLIGNMVADSDAIYWIEDATLEELLRTYNSTRCSGKSNHKE